jgi:hypothetical protein
MRRGLTGNMEHKAPNTCHAGFIGEGTSIVCGGIKGFDRVRIRKYISVDSESANEMRCVFNDVVRRCRMSQDRTVREELRWQLHARTATCEVRESAALRSMAGNQNRTDRTFSHTAGVPVAAACSDIAAFSPRLRHSTLRAGNRHKTVLSWKPLPAMFPAWR